MPECELCQKKADLFIGTMNPHGGSPFGYYVCDGCKDPRCSRSENNVFLPTGHVAIQDYIDGNVEIERWRTEEQNDVD